MIPIAEFSSKTVVIRLKSRLLSVIFWAGKSRPKCVILNANKKKSAASSKGPSVIGREICFICAVYLNPLRATLAGDIRMFLPPKLNVEKNVRVL